MDVLDDDVLRAVGDAQPLSAQHALGTHADDRLVRADRQPSDTRLVVGHLDVRGAGARVAVGAPAGLVDGVLAAVSGALVRGRAAARLGHLAFGALEVELLVEHDAARGRVREPRLELRGAGGNNAGGAAASGGAGCETWGEVRMRAGGWARER